MTTIERGTGTRAPAVDPTRIEEFTERVADLYVGTAITLMIDIGHKTGLFEAAAKGPATCEELAARAGLVERYVREWLGAVATAGIVDFDPETGLFSLPAEHAIVLTGETALNMAVMAPMLSHLGKHVNAVADAFRTGGGVPYSAYRPEFTETMDLLGRHRYDDLLVAVYLPLAPGLVDRLEAGIAVADLGCGTGHCVNLLARAFPNSSFVGFDIAGDALERARAEAAAWGLTNASFEEVDVTSLPAGRTFGLITAFDAIHDQVDPAGVLAAACAALEPDGTFFVLDVKASSHLEDNFSNPAAPLLYAVSTLHCMTVSLAEGGAGLGTAWGEQLATRMLRDAGFGRVEVHELPADPFNLLYVCGR